MQLDIQITNHSCSSATTSIEIGSCVSDSPLECHPRWFGHTCTGDSGASNSINSWGTSYQLEGRVGLKLHRPAFTDWWADVRSLRPRSDHGHFLLFNTGIWIQHHGHGTISSCPLSNAHRQPTPLLNNRTSLIDDHQCWLNHLVISPWKRLVFLVVIRSLLLLDLVKSIC